MKTILVIAAIFSFSELSATSIPASFQQTMLKEAKVYPAFVFVRGHKQGKGYSVQWSMTSNTGIQKFRVEYTYEDAGDPYSNWYAAGEVNNTNTNIFKFTDMGALPGTINYRVIAVMSNNATIVSGTYTCVIGQ